MFSCEDRHPKIQHEEYHCPLCQALEDLEFVYTVGIDAACKSELPSLAQRMTEGC